MSDILLVANNVTKIFYQVNGDNLVVFQNLNLQIKKGQSISIVGSSGSGKSTLLHVLAGLDNVTHGDIVYNNYSLKAMNDLELSRLRNQKFGFVYQFHHLLPEFNVLDNIMMPLYIKSGTRIAKHNYDRLDYILASLNILDKKHNYIGTLSGGQKQRVAIARAILNQPQIIFADEPTGNLDNENSIEVFEIFSNLQKQFDTTVVMVTHNIHLSKKTDLCYELHNKQLQLIS